MSFSLQIMARKGAGALVGFAMAFLTANGFIEILQNWGVTVDPDQLILALGALFSGILEMARNFLKNKLGWDWL